MKSLSELIAPEVVRMTLLAIGWQMDSERHFWRDYKGVRQLIMIIDGCLLFWPDGKCAHNLQRDLPITQDDLLQLIQN